MPNLLVASHNKTLVPLLGALVEVKLTMGVGDMENPDKNEIRNEFRYSLFFSPV